MPHSRWSIIFLILYSYAEFLHCTTLRDSLFAESDLNVDSSKVISQNIDTREDFEAQGESKPFCSMFGCCVPPPSARCCIGYQYDTLSKMCRRLLEATKPNSED